MQSAMQWKRWLLAAMLIAVLGGTIAGLSLIDSKTVVAEEKLPPGDHWRNHDGHWSYWHEADHRWYYTDGIHWYFHDGTRWAIYQFDKLFGRGGFFPGEYHPPGPGVRVEVPHHEVYHR